MHSQIEMFQVSKAEPLIPASVSPLPFDAERRQLTVMFCGLVDATRLASQLDPEDWQEVIQTYQATCAEVIQHFEGHIVQYLGDAALIYFGWPRAHGDDAQRATWTGLGVVEAMGPLNARLEREHGLRLDVRIGIHTGSAVVGDIGVGEQQAQLAMGDTPNIASGIQGLTVSDTVAISEATARLLSPVCDWFTEGFDTADLQEAKTLLNELRA